MKNSELVRLADEGKISPVLVAAYGGDPVGDARQTLAMKARGKCMMLVMYSLSICSVLLCAAGMFLDEAAAEMCGKGGVAFILCLALTTYFLNYFGLRVGVDINYGDQYSWFGDDLELFAGWAGVTVADLAPMSDGELSRLGEQVVVVKAADICQLEEDNREVPKALWQQDAESLRSEFVWRYQTMLRFKRVDGPYGPFFAKAKKLIHGDPAAISQSS